MPKQSAVTPNDFQGSDADRINAAIAAAAGTGKRVVIPRENHARDGKRNIWLLDSAILVPGDTTLELNNCHLKLSDQCRDNMIRSANCGLNIADIQPLRHIHIYGIGAVLLEGADRPRATGDSGKTIGERTFGTDAGAAGESQKGDWRNIGILLAHVEHFSICNLAIKDSHCWAISMERCAHGTLQDLSFASTSSKIIDGTPHKILNQDGIDLRLGCHDILIENITGHTGDDLIALTALARDDRLPGALASTQVSGGQDRGEGRDDIRNVIIKNVRGHSPGRCHIVRLLNSSGLSMYHILIDGLIDTSPPGVQCKAAIKIGDHAYGSGVAPIGTTRNIVATNVISRAKHAILIGGSLCDAIIANVLSSGPDSEAITVSSGPENLRDVTFSNVVTTDPAYAAHIAKLRPHL